MSNHEALRLEELHRYNVLFTPPEAAFERITEFAKRLFGVPIVLISLVDEDLQWFKSCIGLSTSTTSREVSFCQHTMNEDSTLIISDATLDPRFAKNPLVTGPPGIRFYAGAPLINPRGFALGALCIIDTLPHPEGLTKDQQKTLQDLAAITVSEFELRSANEVLTSMKLDLERSNKELAKFSHVVSHDLQTPVRTVGSFAQLLRRQLSGRLSKNEDQNFELITGAAQRMGEMISGLLQFAQVGQAPVNWQDVSTEDIFTAVTGNLKSVIQDHQAEVVKSALPVVQGDPVQLVQLFQNLIANCLKYRSPERRPHILVSCNRHNQQWQFRVEDNGIGIPEHSFGTIFEPLTRLHGSEIPGSGMGLSICRSIVNRHGGQISVASQLGIGTTFSFTLPVVRDAESRSAADETGHPKPLLPSR